MHVTFGLAAHLGIFSPICVAVLIGALPGKFWEILSAQLHNRGQIARRIGHAVATEEAHQTRGLISKPAALVSAVLGITFSIVLFLWNVRAFEPLFLPGAVVRAIFTPVRYLNIDGQWSLFAPRPYRDDGWDIVDAKLADGRRVDLFRNGQSTDFEKPADVFSLYKAHRVQRLMRRLQNPENVEYLALFAKYHCKNWNSTHSGKDRALTIDLIYMREVTPEPGVKQSPIEKRILYSYECDAI
jgi:hypothetical protein